MLDFLIDRLHAVMISPRRSRIICLLERITLIALLGIKLSKFVLGWQILIMEVVDGRVDVLFFFVEGLYISFYGYVGAGIFLVGVIVEGGFCE